MELLLRIAILTHLGIVIAYRPQWGYSGDYGPSQWGEQFFSCGGTRQSPINIDTDIVETESWAPFTFKDYYVPDGGIRVSNNGKTAKVDFGSTSLGLSGGGLKGDYILHSLNFHWGKDSTMGSGHTINSVRYPLEMQIVYYKAAYGDIGGAVSMPDGLAILSVLFEVGETDNEALDTIVNSLSSIIEAGMVSEAINPFPLKALLPANTENFYRYAGSLIVPTCNEVVIWTVFDSTLKISEKQLNAFRSLKTEEGQKLVNNYRPPQPLHGRKVLMRVGGNPSSSGPSLETIMIAVFFLATAAVAVIVKIL